MQIAKKTSLCANKFTSNCINLLSYRVRKKLSAGNAEDQGFGTHLGPMTGRSLAVHLAVNGNWWKHCGGKGGKERNWPPYLKKPLAKEKCS